MRPKLFFFILFFSALPGLITAQVRSNVKFGDVSARDFANRVYPVDSNASAVVIADIGSAAIDGNSKGWFSVVNKHFKRVHILNKNGFDIADVSISLYSNGNGEEEKLDRLRAVTYNLENGKVVETKLDTKSGVFEEKPDKKWKIKKFTFPNVKEGSIIEFDYTTISDFINYLDPWEFQGDYPRLWSEFNLTIPSFFYYVFLRQGYLDYDIETTSEGRTSYNITIPGGVGASEHLRVPAGIVDYRWVVKNAPALKEEKFTSALNNHIQKIQFQLVEQKDPLVYHRYIESWPQVAGELLQSEYFGGQIDKDNGWLNDITGPLVKGVKEKSEKAKKIYEYVRDNFTCTAHSGLYMNQSLKAITKTKNGSVAEINLLLTALLRHENLDADPVILSTRSNGVSFSLYPILSQYNYVICRVKADGKTFYLDASEPNIGFNRLPLRCYNGHARVINKEAEAIELSGDGLTETKITSVFLINDEKGEWVGSLQQTPGYYESLDMRDLIRTKGKEELQNSIKKSFGADMVMSNFVTDSLNRYDNELGIHYDFDVKQEKEDIIYINPMFGEGYKENPFKAAERFYPVEMPFTIDETFNLQLEVLHGYTVDELPKPLIVRMNEQDDGVFEYRISQSGDNISLRCRIRFKRAYFMPEEYETLREFFNLIVKKQAEQIVFKRKK